MSVIAGLQDFRQEGPPADIGTYQFPASIMVFQHTFAGTTYVCAVRAGVRGWVLVDYNTDARVVLQSAINSGLYEITIAPGTYDLSSAPYELQVPAGSVNIVIQGMGWSTILDQRHSTTASVIAVIGTAGSHCHGIIIRDLKCYILNTATYPAIYLTYADACLVQHCYIKAPDWLGVEGMNGGMGILWSYTKNLSILNNYITNIPDSALKCSADTPSRDNSGNGLYTVVAFNHVFTTEVANRSCGDDGFELDLDDGSIVIGNELDYPGESGIKPAAGSIVIGNTIEHAVDVGLRLGADTIAYLNHVRYCEGAGIFSNYGRRMVIVANNIHDNVGDGIDITGGSGRGEESIISNNKIRTNGGYGINLNSADLNDHILVTENLTNGNTSGGCFVGASMVDTRVDSNTFMDGLTDNGIRTRINGLGREAAGIGGTPIAANWNVGDIVQNTSDNTHWIKDYDGTMRAI